MKNATLTFYNFYLFLKFIYVLIAISSHKICIVHTFDHRETHKKSQRQKTKASQIELYCLSLLMGFTFFVSYSRISNYKQCCLYATRYRALVLLPPLFICSSSFFPHPVSDFVFRETSFCYSA